MIEELSEVDIRSSRSVGSDTCMYELERLGECLSDRRSFLPHSRFHSQFPSQMAKLCCFPWLRTIHALSRSLSILIITTHHNSLDIHLSSYRYTCHIVLVRNRFTIPKSLSLLLYRSHPHFATQLRITHDISQSWGVASPQPARSNPS